MKNKAKLQKNAEMRNQSQKPRNAEIVSSEPEN